MSDAVLEYNRIDLLKSKRIQVLRGLAICAVVMIHTNAGGLRGVLIRPHINFCVALFIFLSGYLTKLDYPDWGAFFKRRILKVLIPYIQWTVVYALLNRRPEAIWKYLLTGKAAAPLYFILVYIQFVLLTPLISRLLRSDFQWMGWLITPITVILTRYLFPTLGYEVGFPFPGTVCLPWFQFYYFGLSCGNRQLDSERGKRSPSNIYIYIFYILAVALSTIEGLFWYRIGNYDLATTQIRLSSLGASLYACFIAAEYIRPNAERQLGTIERSFAAIGDYSFEIMLSHILIMRILKHFVPTIMRFPMGLLTIIGSYCFAYIVSISRTKMPRK